MRAGDLPDQDADLATALVLGVVLQPVTFSAYGRLPATLGADRAIGWSRRRGTSSPRCKRTSSRTETPTCPRPLGSLLTSRRFAPLFVTQFLGAFNDNLLKNALGIYVIFVLVTGTGADAGVDVAGTRLAAATLVLLAQALFIAPFFLFSGVSGTLADRVDKAAIARWVKVVEIGIMALGGLGLWLANVPLLLAAVFALGTHSTVFGPIKYALLPQHLRDDELVAGNALIEAGTFLSILLGTIIGGSVVLMAGGPAMVGVIGVVCAVDRHGHGPPDSAGAAGRRRRSAEAAAVRRLVRGRDAHRPPPGPAAAGAGDLVVLDLRRDDHRAAARLRQERPLRRRPRRDADAGALRARRRPRLDRRRAPAARRGQRPPRAGGGRRSWALAAIDLYFASSGRPAAATLTGVGAFVAAPGNWRLLADLVGIAAGGGLFTVPLYAVLQHVSEPSHRSRVIAGNNIINAIAMVAGTGVVGVLIGRGRGRARGLRALRPRHAGGRADLDVDPAARRCCSGWCASSCACSTASRSTGLEHAQAALPHAVIAANHTSFLDGILLGAFLPGEPIFAIDTQIARKWWARPLTLLVNALPVDPTNPLSIRSMIRAVEAGSACVIFPEGRITTTGALMKVYEGPAVIAERTGATLVPVRIEGAEYSPFSRLSGKVRRRWFPKIRIRILPAERLAAPEGVVGRKRRAALRRALADSMVRSLFATAPIDTTLPDALLEARRDPRRQPSDRRRPRVRAAVLRPARSRPASRWAGASRRARSRGERVGVLLPTSRASVVTFFGLLFHGRVPAMLNFSTGAASAEAACTAAEIRLIVTARRFVEKAKLEPLVAALVGEGHDPLPRGREAGDRPVSRV